VSENRYYLSERSKSNMAGIDYRLIAIAKMAILLTRVDFGVPSNGGIRIATVQNALYLKGYSKCDGYRILSKHQSGMALDFYAYVDGKASWDKAHLSNVACAFLQAASILGHKVSWGGLWKNFDDYGHIELLELAV